MGMTLTQTKNLMDIISEGFGALLAALPIPPSIAFKYAELSSVIATDMMDDIRERVFDGKIDYDPKELETLLTEADKALLDALFSEG